jgi:hypothetical protein
MESSSAMFHIQRILALTAYTAAAATGGVIGAAAAQAEPAPSPGPGVPGLTTEQQCAWISTHAWAPCNWIMREPALPGTPGSFYGPRR